VKNLSVLGALGLAASFLTVGCGGTVRDTVLPEDGHIVTCDKGLRDCVGRAEKICGEKGFTIASGYNAGHVLGGSTSAYRKLVYQGELTFYCGNREIPKDCSAPEQDPNAVVQLSSAASAPAEPAALPAKACVPGATQQCVGAAACVGGQVCVADGSGFGPCDCGVAPAAAPAAPAAAQAGSAQGPGR
jgi:hypothetical protein